MKTDGERVYEYIETDLPSKWKFLTARSKRFYEDYAIGHHIFSAEHQKKQQRDRAPVTSLKYIKIDMFRVDGTKEWYPVNITKARLKNIYAGQLLHFVTFTADNITSE
jgi:hypothetical protein